MDLFSKILLGFMVPALLLLEQGCIQEISDPKINVNKSLVLAEQVNIGASQDQEKCDSYATYEDQDDTIDTSKAVLKLLPNCSLSGPGWKDSILACNTPLVWMWNHRDRFPRVAKAFYFPRCQIQQLYAKCDTCNSLIVAMGIEPGATNMDGLRLFLLAGKDTEHILPEPSNQGAKGPIEFTGILGYDPQFTNDLGQEDKFNLNQTAQNIRFPDSGWVKEKRFEALNEALGKLATSSHKVIKPIKQIMFSLAPICNNIELAGIRIYLGLEFLDPEKHKGHTSGMKLVIVGVNKKGNNVINKSHKAQECGCPPGGNTCNPKKPICTLKSEKEFSK